MTHRISSPLTAALAASVALAALSGCATNPFGSGTKPEFISSPADANGVILYEDFRVMVAQEGDTISTMAARVALSDVVLARYNGLPINYLLRPGERLALPDDAQVAAVTDGWTPEVVTGVLDALPDDVATTPQDAPGVQLTRHTVERGETAFSIARLYGVSVTALASWNGLSGDLEITTGRSLIIPPRDPKLAPSQNFAATAPISAPGTSTAVALPPSSNDPLPENLDPQAETVESPQLAAQDGLNTATKFQRPVSGKVVRGYSIAPGQTKSEGLDFETATDAPVVAAESGEVALISRSLGGLGTIVLIRHRDDIMTVYGRVDNVTVGKGQSVTRGQKIGTVAPADPSIFHFEIRRGTQSIDPAPFL